MQTPSSFDQVDPSGPLAREAAAATPDEGSRRDVDPHAGEAALVAMAAVPNDEIPHLVPDAMPHGAPPADAWAPEAVSRAGERAEPVRPRAATLDRAWFRPVDAASTESDEPLRSRPSGAADRTPPRSRRFALLAASVGVSACLGAVGGAAGFAAVGHVLAAPAAAQAEALDDIRSLREAAGQLRVSLKAVGDNVAALRASLSGATAASSAQLGKIAEQVEKIERAQAERIQAERHAAAATETGNAAPGGNDAKSAAGPGIVEGWVVRKVTDGAALVEGRYGTIEIEPGDHLPGVGRIQEIKRKDGRWVVVTPKGLILSAR